MATLKTLSEAETARRRAVTGLHNLGLDEDADRIDGLSTEEYAAEKGFQIMQNPRRNQLMARTATNRSTLQAQLEALKAENEDLQDTVEDLQGQLDDISDIVNLSDSDDDSDSDSDDDLD